MARLAVLMAAGAALVISGCGTADSSSESPQAAYKNLEAQLTKGAAAACESMSGDYKNKLAASVQMFSSGCPAVVKEVGNGLREDKDLRTRSITDVKISGSTASLIAHSEYNGKDVRTKAFMKRGAGNEWILDRDHGLDDVAPEGPVTAYRAYITAFNKGDGAQACELSTARGQKLIKQSLPSSHGGGTCSGAVPYLAVEASKIPEADVVGGEEASGAASLYVLQSTGSGGWAFRTVVMKKEAGKWLFDHSEDLGVAPSKTAPRSPVT